MCKPETREIVMNMPCPFLKNNRCTIYPVRPDMCRNFPVFVVEEGLVIINSIEACAKATHFSELFFEFCHEKHPGYYEYLMKAYNTKTPKNESFKDPIKNAILSIKYVALFTTWLAKKNEPDKQKQAK